MAKSKAELEAENRLLRQFSRSNAIAYTLGAFIRWSGAVVISYFMYRTVAVLAGQETIADIGIRFFTEVKISEAVAWIFGGGGVIYGWRQATLRKDTVERLAGRIQELERGIDPKRTSSRLTPRGEEPPEGR